MLLAALNTKYERVLSLFISTALWIIEQVQGCENYTPTFDYQNLWHYSYIHVGSWDLQWSHIFMIINYLQIFLLWAERLCPTKKHVLKFNPQCDGMWEWNLWEEVIGFTWWSFFMTIISPLRKGIPRTSLPWFHVMTWQEGRQPHTRTLAFTYFYIHWFSNLEVLSFEVSGRIKLYIILVFLLQLPEWTKAKINTQIHTVTYFLLSINFFNLVSKKFKSPILKTHMHTWTHMFSLFFLMYIVCCIHFPSKQWAWAGVFTMCCCLFYFKVSVVSPQDSFLLLVLLV